MKFGKELEAGLIPEWAPKYLDYKQAKKRLKVASRAVRSLSQTPRTPLARAQNLCVTPTSLRVNRDATPKVSGAPNRRRSGDQQQPLLDREIITEDESGQNEPRKETNLQTTSIEEQSPIKSNDSARLSVRYGAISYRNGKKKGSESSDRRKDLVPSLRLPDPALNPDSSLGFARDVSEGPVCTGDSSNLERVPERLTKATETGQVNQPSQQGQSFLSRIPWLYGSKRKTKWPYASLYFARLQKTLLGYSSSRNSTQEDVQLEAYREYERRQAEFYNFLDLELQKIETFYCEKEREALERSSILRNQLDLLQILRRKEKLQNEKKRRDNIIRLNLRSRTGAIVTTDRDIGTSHSRDRPWYKMVKQSAHDRRVGPCRRFVNSQNLDTPISPSSAAGLYSQSDYVRSTKTADISYKVAKQKLKFALVEHYRSLELLKSYALLNGTGFRKITKKYIKTMNAESSYSYMLHKVNRAQFVNSNTVDTLMRKAEDLYAKNFGNGNRKVAVEKLKSKSAHRGNYGDSIFRNGISIAAGMILGIQGLVDGISFLYDPDEVFARNTSLLLQLYAGYFLILLLAFIFCLNCRLWHKSRINYVFVFEYDTRHHLDWRQLFELPCLFLFLLGLSIWLNFRWLLDSTLYQYYPIILIGITVLIMILPLPILYLRSRLWLLHTCWRLFWAGLYPVEFRDFFLGDLLCSQTYSFGNVVLFFCLYGNEWMNPLQCRSSNSRLLGFFTALPAVWRALQCIRRYHDTRNVFPHLVNCGKYFCTILFYMSLSLYRIEQTSSYRSFFIFCATINATYTSIWDLVMDWSLLNPYAPFPLLRHTLAFKQVWAYYVAILLDPILRFTWVFYAIFAENVQHSAVLSILVSTGEVIRRGIWTLFRVENEHCTNVGRFRAYRDIPLPFDAQAQHQHINEDEASNALQNEHTSQKSSAPNRNTCQASKSPASFAKAIAKAPASASASASARHVADIEGQAPLSAEEAQTQTQAASRNANTTQSSATMPAGLSHIGSMLHSAHAQDFERRRRRSASLASFRGGVDDEDEDENENEDEDENEDDVDVPIADGREDEQAGNIQQTDSLNEVTAGKKRMS